MSPIDSRDGIPLHYQVREAIRELILSNAWKPGTKLPNETELCETHGVSRVTVRRAMLDLVREGLVYRKAGKGTFVSPPKIEGEFIRLFFPEEVSDEHRSLQVKKVKASSSIARSLSLSPGSPVYYVERLRFFNNEPTALEESYFSAEIYPGFENERVDGKLYSFLREQADIELDRAETYVDPVIIGEYEAKLLDVEKGMPALCLVRINYSGTKPIIVSRSIMRGDRCRLLVKSGTGQ